MTTKNPTASTARRRTTMLVRQVNAKVSDECFQVLEAAAWVDGTTIPSLVRPLLERYAAKRASEPNVQRARDLRGG